ncbi:hypothetical protein GG344DRAFT_83746 [Lentinula edodes]|nr:hypothetical protein GG344DRAFT_83746 [Lentinula edodes]
MIIGSPWTKQELNVVLLGETGVGKTALVNLLANVCAGTKLEEFDEKIELNNESYNKENYSQTIQPHFYSIACVNGHKLNILDTPGLADAHGIDKDKEHTAVIVDAIRKNFDVIDAIIILGCGAIPQVGASTYYTLTAISNMFTNSIIDNIAFVFTTVTSPIMCAFDTTSLPQGLRNAQRFPIDNPYVQWSKYQKKLVEVPSVNEDLLDEMNEDVCHGYNRATKTLSQFFQFLDRCQIQSTQSILELYTVSTDIDIHISNEYIMQMNNQFEKVRSFRFYKTEDTGSEFNVLCIAETLARSSYCFEEKPGVAPLQRRCNFCGHLVGDHRHYRAKWEEKWRHELMIDSESKIRFDLAKTESEKTAIIMDVEKKELAQLEQDITASMKEVGYLCEKFYKLSLSGRFTLYISAATHLLKLREHEMERDGAHIEDINRIAGWIERWGKKKKILEEAEK